MLLLRRVGFGRVVSVMVVVTSALVMSFAASAGIDTTSLFVTDLPQYQATINFKLDELRNSAAENALFAKVSTFLETFALFAKVSTFPETLGKLNSHQADYSKPVVPSHQPEQEQETERPVPVEIYQPSIGPLVLLQTIAGTALSPLETIGIVLIFVILILL